MSALSLNLFPGRYARFTAVSAGGVLAAAALTYCAYTLHLNLPTSSSLYLLLVVVVALSAGFWEATITSVAAMACLDFFIIPPLFTLNIDDPQNWVALATFETAALIVSRLSVRAKNQAVAEAKQRRSVEKLYDLSRRILFLDRRQTLGPGIVSLIHEVIHAEAVALFDAAEARLDATESCTREIEELARDTYLQDRTPDHTPAHTWARVLRLGTTSVGALVLRGAELDALTVDAVASLTAIALERVRSFDRESRAEAGRQNEQLRAAVLDALAHAFKTPLTAIRVASSGLLETSNLAEGDAALVTLIDDESERLNQLATRLLQMARIDAAELRVRRDEVSVSALLAKVVASCQEQLRGHPVEISADADLYAHGDREMLATAILQFVDNAAKYSTPDSPIVVSAAETDGEVVVSVHNEGPAIPPAERERIFERFYRSAGARHGAPGTGLGLSIVKKTAEAHRGRTWVVSEEGEGTTFFLAVPGVLRRKHEPVAG
ncbi:MAG: ATP-binding protein [Bryobacteraceae bacterium]